MSYHLDHFTFSQGTSLRFEQSGEISINSYSCYLVHSLIICNLPQTPELAAMTSLFQGILKITNNLEVKTF